MTRPMTAEWNCETQVETIREMTDEEYAALLESGWTPGEQNAPTIVEEEDNDAPMADSSSGTDPD